MKKLVTPAILVLLAFVVRAGNQVHACLWDSETLLQERARFPSTLEIIVGKFPRHSDAYHHWRLRDRLAKRKRDPNNDELLDDIAVSYEKLGRCEQAIEVTREQLTRTPDRYESLANRGTFLVHRGELREGLVFLERAIKVNPDAHFGRERYQAILVKYILNRRDAGEIKLPLARERFSSERGIRRLPFLEFLESELGSTWNAEDLELELNQAKQGILGMMRFSRHDSPILLEVLGEVLERLSARQLAFRAYLAASDHADSPGAKKRYRELASHVLEWSLESWKGAKSVVVSESEIESDFRSEQRDANAWCVKLHEEEHRWIERGESVDVLFARAYREAPNALTTDRERLGDQETSWDQVNHVVWGGLQRDTAALRGIPIAALLVVAGWTVMRVRAVSSG